MNYSILKVSAVTVRSPLPVSLWHMRLRASPFRRKFHSSSRCLAIRTQKLGDVGEGITECMLNMWFVEEGARVEEWDKLCEMQSDKAAVEISVSYTGVIKKLYAEANDMVKTGAPLADIDDGLPDEEEKPSAESQEGQQQEDASLMAKDEQDEQIRTGEEAAEGGEIHASKPVEADAGAEKFSEGPSLATPAVRSLLKKRHIDISEVSGSGKDGRVLKADIQAYLENRTVTSASPSPALASRSIDSKQIEIAHSLSPIQFQMFRTMTASLAIPHFLYSDEVNITNLSSLRRRMNQSQELAGHRVTLLPFILKAVSISLNQHPLLNGRVDTQTNSSRPQLIYRSNHNIGIAMDTPVGLLVPVVKNVAALSIAEISHELRRLSELGQSKKLSSADLTGGTITVSNIGNIGGSVVAPVIVEGQVAILGVGKSRAVPVFGESGSIESAEMTNFSWSADHRVVDGATMARMGSTVKKFIEDPARLIVQMR
jgi:2-oxoisovalerate dehydrogenase E2 component (dihydrolipoyl transacylase)